MASIKSTLFLLAAVAVPAMAQEQESKEMGPAAFMWPEDRVWAGDADNTAPCGSVAAIVSRTEFPMTGGAVALVGQDEAWDVELSISSSDNPTTDGDFETLIDAMAFREMDRGHTCVNVADAGSSIAEGDPATLQIKYIADFDSPNNQTFYACADITYVTLSNFESEIPCFNATIPDGDDSDFDHGDLPEFDDPEGEDDSDATEDDDDASDTDEIGDIATLSPEPVDMGSSGLSGGEIAGVVVGTLAGVGLIAGVVIFFYRRRQQRTRTARQQISTRGVSWEEHPGKDSTSQSSIKLQNVSA